MSTPDVKEVGREKYAQAALRVKSGESVRVEDHDADVVRLYLEESFSFGDKVLHARYGQGIESCCSSDATRSGSLLVIIFGRESA